jgi:Zn-dependent M28 family amino/carboxypeptidase
LPAGTTLTFDAPLGAADTTWTWNVLGRLPGREPAAGEAVLLSAHYDHVGVRAPVAGDSIYNGADDDASGTAAVLELARALAAGPRPRRDLLFALFGSEEVGGYGSRYYLARPPVPLDHHVAQIQFEMLGRPDSAVSPGTLWLTGFERSTLGPTLAGYGARLVADPHPDQNFFQRSDNYRFALRGIVAHTVSSYGLHADYHRPSDEIDRIDFAHLARAVASLVEPIRRLADGRERPAWNPGGRP